MTDPAFRRKFSRKALACYMFCLAVCIGIWWLPGGVSTKPVKLQGEIAHAQAKLPTRQLVIATAKGNQPFTVEVAKTQTEQELGLMWREQMEATEGMLFTYADSAPRSMWMKNTLMPLDLVFIGADGAIVDIIKSAKPMSETVLTGAAPAQAVLELRGGVTEAYGIKVGDNVTGLAPEAGK